MFKTGVVKDNLREKYKKTFNCYINCHIQFVTMDFIIPVGRHEIDIFLFTLQFRMLI